MRIQTFSIVVGTKACNAKCPFCVSRIPAAARRCPFCTSEVTAASV